MAEITSPVLPNFRYSIAAVFSLQLDHREQRWAWLFPGPAREG